MTRVDALVNKYPTIPRDIIVKMEVLTLGLKDSDLLDKVSRWHRTAVSGTYGSYDHDVTLKDVADKRPTASKPGYVKHLDGFYLKSGFGARLDRDTLSPYKIRELGSNKYGLFEGEDKVEDVYFPHKPWPYPEREEPLTSKGTPITTLVAMKGPNCFTIAPLRHCEYFATGEQCKFCNFNSTQQDVRSVGGLRAATSNLEETVEAYKILSSEVRLIEGAFVSGAIGDLDRQTDIHVDFIEKIARAASYKPDLVVSGQPPKNRKGFQRLRDAGLERFITDIEVWDPRLFAEICPGKAKHVGHERYKEAYLEASDVFGAGNVMGTMVAGATLIPPNGHKTWQESRDVLIDGLRWMTKNGIVPLLTQFRWSPGSEFSKDPSGRDKVPPVEHHLDLILAHHAAMKEYGLYEKMNRFTSCTMDCSVRWYKSDLGILEIAGGPEKWLDGMIPDDLNWLARFVESVKTPAEAKPV